jgi:hypothetical protein
MVHTRGGVGIRNCIKPSLGIKLGIKVDNCDYQKNQMSTQNGWVSAGSFMKPNGSLILKIFKYPEPAVL